MKKRPFEFDVYLESDAGGYCHRDCTVAFYTRIGALLTPSMTILNLGAGRGANILSDYSPFRSKIQRFKGRVKRVIGIDIDKSVLGNPDLDEAYVINQEDNFPLKNQSIDMIICDHVIEHIELPDKFTSEIKRVLKPGGWFCARTPTKWGYIGFSARVIPNGLHKIILKYLQPTRKTEDIFPTKYLLNTVNSIRKYFPEDEWKNHAYGYNGVPSYHGNKLFIFRLIEFWCWLMPRSLSAKLHIFIRKM